MSRGGIEPPDVTHFIDSGLHHFKNSSGTKCVTLLENPALPPDDQQALETIISLWPGLSPETKIEILQVIEAARREAGAVVF